MTARERAARRLCVQQRVYFEVFLLEMEAEIDFEAV